MEVLVVPISATHDGVCTMTESMMLHSLLKCLPVRQVCCLPSFGAADADVFMAVATAVFCGILFGVVVIFLRFLAHAEDSLMFHEMEGMEGGGYWMSMVNYGLQTLYFTIGLLVGVLPAAGAIYLMWILYKKLFTQVRFLQKALRQH